MRRPVNFNWLIVLAVSWAIPVYWPRSYLFSLLFWLLPIVVLLPDFLAATDTPTHRRRRALWYATAWIVVLGIVLDFGFGTSVLKFEAEWYWFRLRGVPVEELLFYAFGPMAILLVYAWCDEHWLNAYNNAADRERALKDEPALLRVSPRIVAAALGLLAGAVVVKRVNDGSFALPLYAAFLIAAAFVPASAAYRSVGAFVNWRAFGATSMYVIGTSLAYEVTLAIPLRWWGYRREALLGIIVDRWSLPDRPFPIEAAIVWVAAPFSAVLTYEFAKAYLHHPAPATKARLVGRSPSHDRTQ